MKDRVASIVILSAHQTMIGGVYRWRKEGWLKRLNISSLRDKRELNWIKMSGRRAGALEEKNSPL